MQEANKELRKLAAKYAKYCANDSMSLTLKSLYLEAVGEGKGSHIKSVYGVTTAELEIHHSDKIIEVNNPIYNSSIAELAGLNSHGEQQFQVVYSGKKPKIIVTIGESSHTNSDIEQYQPEPVLENDELTKPLSAMEIADFGNFETALPSESFQNEFEALIEKYQISKQDQAVFLSGVFAKTIYGSLPPYSKRKTYNLAKEDEFAMGAYSVVHQGNLLFCQTRRLDGNLGHFGGFGWLDGNILEQPFETVNREAIKEIPVIGDFIANIPAKPLLASVFVRKEPFPNDLACGFDRELSEKQMQIVLLNNKEARISLKMRDEIREKTNQEVESYLVIPFSIALYLQDQFQYPHEFEAAKEVASRKGIAPISIPHRTEGLLAEIATFPNAKAWTIIVKRMSLDAAYDAVLYGRNPEKEFTKSLDKYANAILSYLNPAKYDINGSLMSLGLYEVERYLHKKFPRKLAKELNFEEYKKQGSLQDVISQHESTDVLYAAYNRDELFEMYDLYRRALGFEDIKILTTETLKPERTFLYEVTKEVNAKIGYEGIKETDRGLALKKIVDRVYPHTKAAYNQELAKQSSDIEKFISEDLLKAVYTDISCVPEIWQKEIIAVKENIASRIRNGEYLPQGEGKTAEDIIHSWIALKYRHYQQGKIGEKIVAEFIEANKGEFNLLEQKPLEETIAIAKTSGSGGGKTESTIKTIDELVLDITKFAVYDSDPIKFTLAAYAFEDGVIKGDMRDQKNNWGVRVHRESSNLNYEFALKIREIAKLTGCRPDMIINMLFLGDPEIMMCIEGGGKIDAEFITIEIDSVWQDVLNRYHKNSQKEGSFANRLPPESVVRGSHIYGNNSLSRLGNYKDNDIKMTLKERVGGDCSNIVGEWDIKNNVMKVFDWMAFTKMAQRAKQQDKWSDSLAEYLKDINGKGTHIEFCNRAGAPVFSINNQKDVVVADGMAGEFNEIRESNNNLFLALQSIKNRLIIGGNVITAAQTELAV